MSGIVTDFLYTAGVTQTKAVAGTVINMTDADLLAIIQPTTGPWAGYSATSILISCVISGLYYAFGADPVADGSLGHPFSVGDSLDLKNFNSLKALRFIRQGTSSGALMITPFFSNVGK